MVLTIAMGASAILGAVIGACLVVIIARRCVGTTERRVSFCLTLHKVWSREYHAACDVEAGLYTLEEAADNIRQLEAQDRSELN